MYVVPIVPTVRMYVCTYIYRNATQYASDPMMSAILATLSVLLQHCLPIYLLQVRLCTSPIHFRRKVVEKQFIVQRSSEPEPPKESAAAWNPYSLDESGV